MTTYLEQLETPVPIVDMDRLAFNLDRMAAYATLHGLQLRPHVKTHKSPRIAADQLRLGAVGLTCATLREAEVMAEVCEDLLVAYPPVGAARLERLARLPRAVRVTVAADDANALDALNVAARLGQRQFDVLVEADLGMHRVGVSSPERAVAIAKHIDRASALNFAGMLFYPGHIREAVGEQGAALSQLGANIATYVQAFEAAGLPPRIVSGGSTPAAWRMHEVPGVTEVRPGTYVYNDRTTAMIGACDWDDCALTVLATVVSVAVKGQAVIDAGTKALGREPLRAEGDGYGALLDHPEVVVSRMSEEHGILDLSKTDWRPRLGDQVRVVPNHVCIVVHLFDEIIGVRGHAVETRWPVEARGRGPALDELAEGPSRPRAV
ncbi:alanine racemase [Gemmatimonas groenlandica]|uniref:D-TA family PLP-dependent enzyme n=1 Tax=Gemmatimonas groenlandica TaxID=2732249 RepID=A0A6M4IJT6_9BACT|nr:alanine racemase [Gemmatimonas groenlandica]QJR34325.1 D-TA family PLP-dependent enzyme [Gemmatimonas groenlandica]